MGMWDGIYSSDIDKVDIIKPVPYSDTRPTITMLSMFIGRRKMFKKWLKEFKKLKKGNLKIHVLWLVFSKQRSFIKQVKKAFMDLSGYHSKTLVINYEHRVATPGDRKGGNWVTRNQAITDGYNFSRQYIDNPDFVFLYEDDVVIPPDGLLKLLPYMDNNHIGAIVGRVPYRPNGRHRGKTLAWEMEAKHIISNGTVHTKYEVWYLDKQYSGVEGIGSGTFGCTLIRGPLYSRVVMINELDGIMGPDVTYGLLLKRMGYKMLIDHGIHCKQLHETRRGVEVYA